MSFLEFSLHPHLITALQAAGYDTPTPIQVEAIPAGLQGLDVLGAAQTGTGKTAAFALPILHRLLSDPKTPGRNPRVLVLTPTRELASQVGQTFFNFTKGTKIKTANIFGGVSQVPQEKALARGVDILVATPGRLMDLLNQGLLKLSALEVFVLDEADRMLDMGFITDIQRIAAMVPPVRQTLLFSATFPTEIRQLAKTLLKNPVEISVSPVSSIPDLIQQQICFVEKGNKIKLLLHLLKQPEFNRVLIFTRTKHGANKLSLHLDQQGIRSEAIHGNKSQAARERALQGFKGGRVRVLVATDLASRGLHIEEISHVINYELPNDPESFVHRIGRTGRAGAEGKSIAFCSFEEREFLREIEMLTGIEGELITDHPFAASFQRLAPRKKSEPFYPNKSGNQGTPGGGNLRYRSARDGDSRGGSSRGGSGGGSRGGSGGGSSRGGSSSSSRSGSSSSSSSSRYRDDRPKRDGSSGSGSSAPGGSKGPSKGKWRPSNRPAAPKSP